METGAAGRSLVSIMSMPTPPLGIWSIWKELSFLQRLTFAVLVVVSVYSFFTAIRVLLQLRSMRGMPSGDRSVIRQSLSKRCTNLQQLITSIFYLFGIVLFIGLQRVGVFVGDGNFSTASVILGNFVVDCAFASNVFVVLLVLQILQWFASSRVNSSLGAFR